ncbi:MAG TPA: dockerin type I domain-containing protein, partial [Pirellulaceae bacterium]|nr:dockerin type I domain-containing protein [Pirellulaceae bacterium]
SAAPFSTTVTTFAAGLLSLHWRYSNSTASSNAETLHVTLDGRPPVSLGLPGTGPSVNDWNTFAVTDTLYFDEVAPGPHTLVVAISGGDELAELDYLSVGFHRSLESGTATSYGVGSSVTHVPGPSVDGLYEVARLGLNHPRFGPADAFNLDISAAKPGLRSTSGGGLLRDSGDWAHYTGFAIDEGPLALAIDAYLNGGSGLGLAMSDPRLVETLASLFPNYLNGHQNPLQPLDVDADGTVAPIDALQIVNRLNSPQYDALHARLPILPHRSAPARYLDTNGDRFLAPSDVLAIVNHLNAQAAGAAEGEQNQAAGNANFADGPSAVSASTATASAPAKSVRASAVSASTVNAAFDAGLLQWLDEEPSRRRRDRRN